MVRREFVPQHDLAVAFKKLEEKHIEDKVTHDWKKKYRLLKTYFQSQMSIGITMTSIQECTAKGRIRIVLDMPMHSVDNQPPPQAKMDRWAVLRGVEVAKKADDENEDENEDENKDGSDHFVDDW